MPGAPRGPVRGRRTTRDGTTLSEVSVSLPNNRSLPLIMEERRVLSLAARGLSVIDVAEAMGISSEVVRIWLASAMDKLGARSKLEAVIIAARRGEIDLSS